MFTGRFRLLAVLLGLAIVLGLLVPGFIRAPTLLVRAPGLLLRLVRGLSLRSP